MKMINIRITCKSAFINMIYRKYHAMYTIVRLWYA